MKSVKCLVWSEAELSMLSAQITDGLWVYVLCSLWGRVHDQIDDQVKEHIINEIQRP